LEVFIISITGILVVFTFLLFLYLLMLGFKKFLYKETPKKPSPEISSDKSVEPGISEEVLVSILTALKRYKNKELKNKKITIKKRRS